MATSTEYLTQVSNLYVALFNRAPDTEGMKFWSEGLANGASLSAVTNGFLMAPEGQAIYAPDQSASEFVSAFYQTVFGRAPDAGGLEFWMAALESAGGVESPEARVFLVNSIVDVVSTPLDTKPEGLSDAEYAATLNDRALFGNKVAYATFVGTYANSTVTPGTQTSLAAITADPASVTAAEAAFGQPANPGGGGGGGGNPDPVSATPIVGTDGDDDLTVADAASFTKTGFSVDGLDGKDTLTVQKATGAIDATDKITSIEVLKVTTTGATTIDATHFAGVASFGSHDAGASLAVSNLAEGQATTVSGANVDTSFGFNETATAATLALADAQGGAVHVTGTALASLAVTAAGAEEGAGNSIALLDVTGSTVTAISIDATSALTVESITGVTDGSLTVTGTAQVGIGGVEGITSVDASANTGGIAVFNLIGATSFIGTEAADILGISGTTGADATIDLGAGNDQLTFLGDVSFDATGLTVTTGDGADVIDVSALTLITGSDEGMAAKLVTIADFSAGDSIVFSAAESTAEGSIESYDVAGAESLYLAANIALAAASAETTPLNIAAFLFEDATYLVADIASEGAYDGAYGIGDVLVKLAGTVDLSTVSLFGNSVVFAEVQEPVAV